MSDDFAELPDGLDTRFAAFRADSLARTRPPGAVTVARTVRRRHAVRATSLGVLAVLALVLAGVSVGGARPTPITPTAPAPHVTLTPGPLPGTGTASPDPSPTATPSTTPTPPPTSTRRGPCDENAGDYVGMALAGGPNTFTMTPAMLSVCPKLTVRVNRATYVATGTHPATLARTGYVSRTLTPSDPTATVPALSLPAGHCYWFLTVTWLGTHGPPSTVPASYVTTFVATGSSDDFSGHWGRGYVVDLAASKPDC